jgi:glycosyltransferase involved in cell wall biosynthesis
MTNKIKKPVVMQILPSLESGGVERGTIDIAKALKKTGFTPIVVSKGGTLVYQLKEDGITHIALPVHSKNPFTIYSNISRLIKLITEYKVDVIHVRSRAPMWSAYFACKKTGTKLVATVHGTYNAIMLKADKIIVVSNFIKEYLAKNYRFDGERFPARKITVIQRGVDLSYFDSKKISKNHVIEASKKWNLPEDKKIIIMPARFTSWKGHEFFLEALKKVKGDFFCMMVGSDHGHSAYKESLEQKIVDAGLASKVKLFGLCKEMAVLYSISRLVVCPSIRPEAFGRIAIEAQAASKIIISTNIGGSLETIINTKTGFLVEVGDTEKFAKLIDFVLEMPQNHYDVIATAARKHMEENFSNDKMCQDTIEIYNQLLHK